MKPNWVQKLGIMEVDPSGKVQEPEPRTCYFISEREKTSDGEYIPLIAKEGTKGYYRTDWTWGKDLELAKEVATEKNERLGLSPEDVKNIIWSTFGEPGSAPVTLQSMNSKTAASVDELVSGMEALGWHDKGESKRNWRKFQRTRQRNLVSVFVALLEGVPATYQVLNGELDSETSKLLEGMM